ncbi:MAG: hypothetical protein J3Q66DRAFT_412260 [Benniella sp.]|nr:MAG: hypothetical protein J3Q66DRAFT_412260 [Benniella sp.]
MTQDSLTFRSVFRSVSQAVILVLGASLILSARAQSYQPMCASEATYTSLEGRGLYIQGGLFKTGLSTAAAFMIDLSESWDINNPKYKELPGGRVQYHSASGITSDGKLWTILTDVPGSDQGSYGSSYNATSNNWSDLFQLDTYSIPFLTGATDHKTDMMYIPFGYANADRTKGMLRVSLKTGDTTSDCRSHSMNQQDNYATAWNPLRKSVIYVSQDGVFQYTWEKGWNPFFSKGLDILPEGYSCLVSVSGGTKMALFGGINKEKTATIGDIYVLDLTKQGKERWIKAPVDSKQKSQIARQGAACGSTGDQVIIWGGNTLISGQFQRPKQQTLVFNVKTMKWTDRYIAPKKTPE